MIATWILFASSEFTGRARYDGPGTPITLRHGARVIEDSRRLRLAWSDKGQQGGEGGDEGHSDRDGGCRRSGRNRPDREPGLAGRQRHRRIERRVGGRRKKPGADPRAVSVGAPRGGAREGADMILQDAVVQRPISISA